MAAKAAEAKTDLTEGIVVDGCGEVVEVKMRMSLWEDRAVE